MTDKPSPEDTPAPEDTPSPEDSPSAEDTLSSEDTSSPEDMPSADDTPAPEDTLSSEDAPSEEDTLASEDTSPVASAESEATDADTATADAMASASSDDSSAQFGSFIEHPSGFRFKDLIWATPSWLISTMVHAVVMLVMALVTVRASNVEDLRELIASAGSTEQLDVLDDFDDAALEEIDLSTTDVTDFSSSVMESTDVTFSDFDESASAISVNLNDMGLDTAPRSDMLADIGSFSGDEMSGRGKGKGRMVAEGGGNEASEAAVASALKWLAAHQLPDGSWCFDHTVCPQCKGQCRNPGDLATARNGATALALLPFLGAGQTHTTGKYQKQVRAGLYYLVSKIKVDPAKGGSLFESGGSMYSHGLAAITLCEAWGMTHDKGLKAPAQLSLNFISWAQDPVGGGWRYSPRKGGDTSVVGWQIMALKSGHMAYLAIPPITVQKASKYLNSVQAKDGAAYGYATPGAGQATTAIGLLCRMHLGWKKDNPALQRGIQWISDQGPSKSNAYYNYYATQVMRHNEGPLWDKWNNVMRDQLVKAQATAGHERGSWAQAGAGHTNAKGGRLYETAMSTMVLEVYYRHMPIYRKQSTEADFPLD